MSFKETYNDIICNRKKLSITIDVVSLMFFITFMWYVWVASSTIERLLALIGMFLVLRGNNYAHEGKF